MTATNIQREIDKECVHSPFYIFIQKESGVRILLLLDARYSNYYYLIIRAHHLFNKFNNLDNAKAAAKAQKSKILLPPLAIATVWVL